MNEQIQSPATWTPQQATTILELVEALAEAIWRAHGDAITQHNEELYGPPTTPHRPNDEHDDIPF
jgi:hypothetical protein